MRRATPSCVSVLLAALTLIGSLACHGSATAQTSPMPSNSTPPFPVDDSHANELGPPPTLLRVPVSRLFPGAVPTRPTIKNPNAGDPNSPERGMRYFLSFNCVGCHAENGGGGMGPALSNSAFIYGGQPENIYLTIAQGRPNGMPAWGAVLPPTVIWDLVNYVLRISNEPKTEWGTTVSRVPQRPALQQVPAELVTTSKPWSQTQPFGNGKKP